MVAQHLSFLTLRSEGNIAGVHMKEEDFLKNFLLLKVTPVSSQQRGWFPV